MIDQVEEDVIVQKSTLLLLTIISQSILLHHKTSIIHFQLILAQEALITVIILSIGLTNNTEINNNKNDILISCEYLFIFLGGKHLYHTLCPPPLFFKIIIIKKKRTLLVPTSLFFFSLPIKMSTVTLQPAPVVTITKIPEKKSISYKNLLLGAGNRDRTDVRNI